MNALLNEVFSTGFAMLRHGEIPFWYFLCGTWVAVAIGGSAVLGAGASIYSGSQAAAAARAGQRNLGSELGTTLGQVPAASAAGLQNQQQYAPAYAALGNANLAGGLFGAQSMSGYAKTPNVAAAIAHARSTGYYDSSWSDEDIAGDYYRNIGQKQGDQLPRDGNGLVNTLDTLQGSQDQANALSATVQRNANVTDIENLSPRAAAALRSANPEYYQSLGRLNSASGASIGASPYESTYGALALGGSDRLQAPGVSASSALTRRMSNNTLGGPAALERTLYDQAQGDLALGGDLSAQEQRNATASSRAAYSSRGLGDSNSALAAEVLNLDSARTARLNDRRAFASGVTAQLRSGQAADRGYGLNLDAATLARDQLRGSQQLNTAQFNASQRQADLNALGTADAMGRSRGTEQFGRLATATQLSSANQFDPSSVLGGVDNRLSTGATIGQAAGLFPGAPDYTGQLLGYGSDLNSSNANARVAGGLAQANAYSAAGGALFSAAGSLGSAYLRNQQPAAGAAAGACWIARAVYGEQDPRWREFRAWLIARAPESLATWYFARGESAARTVQRDPRLKARVRAFMDAKILELHLQAV